MTDVRMISADMLTRPFKRITLELIPAEETELLRIWQCPSELNAAQRALMSMIRDALGKSPQLFRLADGSALEVTIG